MKLLLFGADGQIGWELQRALSPLGELVVVSRDPEAKVHCDFQDTGDLSSLVGSQQADVIVNAAAYTAVDSAETEQDLAYRINAHAVGVIAEQAKKSRSLLVHYSTDYVFDGSGERPWTEEDAVNPCNVYGSSKWQGEDLVRRSGAQHLILRTSWIYSLRGKNFLKTILKLAMERDSLQVINDQVGAPTSAELAADVTAHAIRDLRDRPELTGTYHLAARGEASWYDYAQFAIGVARAAGWMTAIEPGQIKPIDTEAFAAPAQRPKNSRLDVRKLESTFQLRMPDWRAGVYRAVTELVRTTAAGH